MKSNYKHNCIPFTVTKNSIVVHCPELHLWDTAATLNSNWVVRYNFSKRNIYIIILRDFSSFDKMLVHHKLQTCFVLPGLFSAIRSFQKIPLKLNEFEPVMYNPIPMYSLETLKMNICKCVSIYALVCGCVYLRNYTQVYCCLNVLKLIKETN